MRRNLLKLLSLKIKSQQIERPFNSFPELNHYSKWPEIFRSWFWRFYDHLFQLVFFNFSWMLSCSFIAWIFFHFKWVDLSLQINLLHVYLFYVVENIASIGWAYLVFQIFIEGNCQLTDILIALKKYSLKATGLSIVSGFLIILAIYNIKFYYFEGTSHRFLSFLSLIITFWIFTLWLASCLYQWPILFFQNPPFHKIFYKSFLLVFANAFNSILTLAFFILCFALFSLVLFPWFFIGAVFFFGYQCIALEKGLLRYRIIYGNKPLDSFLEVLDRERQRGLKSFFKPWENS